MTSIKGYSNHLGNTGFIELKAQWRDQGFLNFGTNYSGAAYLFLEVKDIYYMYCGNNIIYFHKTTTQASDDRLKEN